jgi:hypothetical protein
MVRIKSLELKKSRKIRDRFRNETWVTAGAVIEFSESPTLAEVEEVIADIDTTLELEEKSERIYWEAQHDKN